MKYLGCFDKKKKFFLFNKLNHLSFWLIFSKQYETSLQVKQAFENESFENKLFEMKHFNLNYIIKLKIVESFIT